MDLEHMLRVGSWRIVRRLGESAGGVVLLLQHVDRARLAIAKIPRIEGRRSVPEHARKVRYRLEQQRLAALALGLDRVVVPLDLSRLPDGTPFIVLDYVEGQTLLEELRTQGPPVINRVIQIGTRIAGTLADAHAHGLVHGELEPLHVLIGRRTLYRDLEIRLLEFGAVGPAGEHKPGLLRAVEPIGVPGYMCPEAWAGEVPSGAFDVFSLGVILFQLLTEKLPFPLSSRSFTQSMLNLLDGEVPPVELMRSAELEPVPPALDQIIRRALAKRAADRPTMAAVRDLLACCIVDDVATAAATAVEVFELPGSGPVVLPAPAPPAVLAARPPPARAPAEAAALLELDTPRAATSADAEADADGEPASMQILRRGLVSLAAALVVGASALGIVWWQRDSRAPVPHQSAAASAPAVPAPIVAPLPPPAPIISAAPDPPATRTPQRRTRLRSHAPPTGASR